MSGGVHQHLDIVVCDTPEHAIEQGYNYRLPKTKAVDIKKVVVVRRGTTHGNSTVDFLMEDEDGQQYVFLVTRKLLDSIPY